MTRRSNRSRVVGYKWGREHPHLEGEKEILDALAKARAQGTVTEYDSDNSFHCVWFNGHPGAKIRALRDLVDRLNPGARILDRKEHDT